MQAVERVFERVLKGCAALSAAILAGIALSISVNVVLRNAFDAPVYGLLEAVEYGLLAVTFLGAPWVLSQSAHVTVDLVTTALRPAVARILARLTAAVGLGVSLVAMRYGIEAAAVSFGRGSMVRTAFVFPEWWLLSIMPLGFGLIALEFLRQVLRGPRARGAATGL